MTPRADEPTGEPRSVPAEVLPIVAQLAASLLRGAARPDAEIAARLGRLGEHPCFARPLARAARAPTALAALPLDADFVRRVGHRARSRLCALLVCRPPEEVDRAALLVSAAVHHRDVVGAVLKSDRERLRDALGEEAIQVVTHEALLLHAPLVELGADDDLVPDGAHPDHRRRFLSTGRRVFARFLALVEPALFDAGCGRWFPEGAPPRSDLENMTDHHCDHVVRLLRRRMPPWATLTA